MRFPCNRRIFIDSEGKSFRTDEYFNFKIKKKGYKLTTIKCMYENDILYITKAFKINKKGCKVWFYIVSNYHNRDPQEHLDAYNLRWNIEKFFRTTKQYLGLGDCQSTKIKHQNAHINSVFISYILIEYIRKIKKYKCPEDVINRICYKKPSDLISYFNRFNHIFNELKC